MEAGRQDVLEEAPDELVAGHGLLALAVGGAEPARRDTDDSLTSYLRRCRHSYRLRYRRSRPFNFGFFATSPLLLAQASLRHADTATG